MARQPRNEVEAGIHHVYARGNERRPIFWDDRDRRTYLRLLAKTIERTGWRCLAFCLMGNHVHLVIETREPNLGDGMRYLHGCYARLFNDRYRRDGHLFRGRYGSTRVESDAQLFAVLRYVALNPVEANFCDRAEDYAWSSYAGVLAPGGLRVIDGDRLLSYLAAAGGDPRRRYRELVDDPQPLDGLTPNRGRSAPHDVHSAKRRRGDAVTTARSKTALIASLLAAAAFAVGCGGDDNNSDTSGGGGADTSSTPSSQSTPENLDDAVSQCLDQAKQLPDESRKTAEEACKAAKSGDAGKVKDAAKKQCLDALKQVPDSPQKDQAKERCEAIK